MSEREPTMEDYKKHLEDQEVKKAAQRKLRAENKATYDWLTEDLLGEKLDQAAQGYTWRPRKHLEGLGGNQHVDVAGSPSSQRHHVYIEIEGARSNPVSNVAKIWRHMVEGKISTSILIIQIFSPTYRQGSPHTRMEESIFIGEQADRATPQIIYRVLRPDSWPDSIAGLNNLVERVYAFIREIEQFDKEEKGTDRQRPSTAKSNQPTSGYCNHFVNNLSMNETPPPTTRQHPTKKAPPQQLIQPFYCERKTSSPHT